MEADAVWLALYHRGEYGNSPGGLLRWDRKTHDVRRCDVRSVATAIVRVGDATYLGTTDGIVAVRGLAIHSYFVDRTATGHFDIVEH